MLSRVPATRVKVPCNDEGDFYVRLADHIAEHGLRIPAERALPIGDRLGVVLEFRDGGTLSGEAVVAAHVRLGDGVGMNVRFVRFDRSVSAGRQRAPAASTGPPPPFNAPADASAPGPDDASSPGPDEVWSPGPDDASSPGPDDPWSHGPVDAPPAVSPEDVEIVACPEVPVDGEPGPRLPVVGRWWRAVRNRRRAAAVAALAVAVALAAIGYAMTRRPATPEEEAADHLARADRQLAAGRVTGEDGALEHLLAAKRLRPRDPVPAERLSRLADMLEDLGQRALGRGELYVASIHLTAARQAAPGRASIRAKLEALSKAQRTSGSRAPHERRPAAAGR